MRNSRFYITIRNDNRYFQSTVSCEFYSVVRLLKIRRNKAKYLYFIIKSSSFLLAVSVHGVCTERRTKLSIASCADAIWDGNVINEKNWLNEMTSCMVSE